MRVRVLQLLDTVLLPETLSDGGPSLTEAERAHGLATMYASFDPSTKVIFELIQRDRAATQRLVSEFVVARDAFRAVKEGFKGTSTASGGTSSATSAPAAALAKASAALAESVLTRACKRPPPT